VRRRSLAAVTACIAALVWCGSVQAQSFSSDILLIGLGGSGESQLVLPVTVSGTIAIDFHGSTAGGCAPLGRCELSGTEVFDPGRSGVLVVLKARVRGKRVLAGVLELGSGHSIVTTSHTERTTASGGTATCGDAAASLLQAQFLSAGLTNSLSIRIGGSAFPFGQPIFGTRCPGPLDSDVTSLLPSRRLPRAVLRHGGTIDLSTTRPFSRGGFDGTLRSTMVLRFGRGRHPNLGNDFDFGGKAHRVRDTVVGYRVRSVTGAVNFAFSGLGDPAQCLTFDACGETGSMTLSPQATGGSLSLELETSAGRPRRDVRTLLGLARGGDTRGLVGLGVGDWTSRTGAANALLNWRDGSAPCTDRLPLHSGILTGEITPKHLEMIYGGVLSGSPPQSRCGGPLVTDFNSTGSFALGAVPTAALRHRTVTIHLTRDQNMVPTAAWQGSLKSDLTVTLVRTRVRERVSTVRF
jgi:hypothetical protein